MQINSLYFSELPCVEKISMSGSSLGMVNELVSSILYGDKNNVHTLNSFLKEINFDGPIIEDIEDVVLFLRALDNQLYKDQLIKIIDVYLVDIAYDSSLMNLFILLNKVNKELETLDTLKLAHQICCNNGYIEGNQLEISKNISDLISNEFADSQMNKSMEYGNEVMNQYKTKTMVNIFKFLSIVYFLYHLFN